MKRFIYILVTILLSVKAYGSSPVKRISVSAIDSFSDYIELKNGNSDMDIIVKFVFDEAANELGVSLISHQKLFAFREDIIYKSVIKSGKLRPEKLPYVVEYDPKSRYKVKKPLKSIIKATGASPKRYKFDRWITYQGVQPQPTDQKMVNYFIEQKFYITAKRGPINISLHDILLMRRTGDDKREDYELYFLDDMKLNYEIEIIRNPCFNQEEGITKAQDLEAQIAKSYDSFFALYGDNHQASSQAEKDTFNQLKSALLTQYMKIEKEDSCSDIEKINSSYNHYIDLIESINCSYVEIPISQQEIDAAYILEQSRLMDNKTARWLVTQDKIEREDIEQWVDDCIKSLDAYIGEHKVSESSSYRAITIYDHARNAFIMQIKRK